MGGKVLVILTTIFGYQNFDGNFVDISNNLLVLIKYVKMHIERKIKCVCLCACALIIYI